MLIVYLLALLLLGATHRLFRRRAASLERKFTRVAREAEDLLRQGGYRDGNSNRTDVYQSAKRQYRLGLLAQKKDQVEARYVRWQGRADRARKLLARLRGWQGRLLPYALGALDVATALFVADYLDGGQHVNARSLLQAVSTLLAR